MPSYWNDVERAKQSILRHLGRRGGASLVADIYDDFSLDNGFPLSVISSAITLLIADKAIEAEGGTIRLSAAQAGVSPQQDERAQLPVTAQLGDHRA